VRLAERRAHFRKGLHPLYLPYYDALCGVLDEKWQPFFGVRSIAEQDRLYAFGRTTGPTGRFVTRAKGGESPHNYGCATDWTVFDAQGRALWPKAPDPLWKEYQNALEKVGLRWGADWDGDGDLDEKGLIDCPHNELVIDGRWPYICKVLVENGAGAADEMIRRLAK